MSLPTPPLSHPHPHHQPLPTPSLFPFPPPAVPHFPSRPPYPFLFTPQLSSFGLPPYTFCHQPISSSLCPPLHPLQPPTLPHKHSLPTPSLLPVISLPKTDTVISLPKTDTKPATNLIISPTVSVQGVVRFPFVLMQSFSLFLSMVGDMIRMLFMRVAGMSSILSG